MNISVVSGQVFVRTDVSILLVMYVEVESLGHIATVFGEELPDCFPKQLHCFTFPPAISTLVIYGLSF